MRHILANHSLPIALSRDRLLRMSLTREDRLVTIHAIADKLFANTKVDLDLRVGSANITPPQLEDMQEHFADIADLSIRLSEEALPGVVGAFLNRICSLVSSVQHSSVVAPENMLHLFSTSEGDRKRFSHNNVLFTPMEDGRWHVTSTPIRKSESSPRLGKVMMRFAPYPGPALYRLFDNRWWIKVYNPAPMQRIVLRYLRPVHLKVLFERLTKKDLLLTDISDPYSTARSLTNILSAFTEPSDKFWLPVLVTRTPEAETRAEENMSTRQALFHHTFLEDESAEQILAFPALNLKIAGCRKGAAPWWMEQLGWEVWYKQVDGLEGRLEDCVALPESREERGLESADEEGKKGTGSGRPKVTRAKLL